MKNLKGIGIDIIEVARIARVKNNSRFLKRCFLQSEIDYCFTKRYPERSLAARFAAKEAVGKALGVGIMNRYLRWKDVEILRTDGKPTIKLHGPAGILLKDAVFHLSLTHTKELASAIVFFECENFDEMRFRKMIKEI
jgi:holo-[acyl-carrier protein] synthase